MQYMIILKILGIVFTLGASTALGLYMSSMGRFRLQDLQELKKALLILKSEIEYVSTPLPEAMLNISKRTSGPIAKILLHFSKSLKSSDKSAYQLWISSIDAHKKETFLKSGDLDIIGSFGKTLGYLDKQMQVETIKYTTDYINTQIAQLQEDNNKSQRMYRSLGVIGGILLLVIFW